MTLVVQLSIHLSRIEIVRSRPKRKVVAHADQFASVVPPSTVPLRGSCAGVDIGALQPHLIR
jgi:hypothetical protein